MLGRADVLSVYDLVRTQESSRILNEHLPMTYEHETVG